MSTSTSRRPARPAHPIVGVILTISLLGASVLLPTPADAATASIGLATADNFAVLAGSGISNTGSTTITGDIGTFPTATETGTGSITLTGADHGGDAVTQQAKDDLVTAYGVAAGRGPATEVATDLGGQTLTPGVYDSANGTFGNTGVLTLDGQNLTDPVFVLQMEATLITGSASSVNLINGADACNVYWQVGSSATLGTASTLRGSILALTSITMTTGATLEGRALAQEGAVTLDDNTITRAACTTPTDTTTTLTSETNPTASGEGVTFTVTVEGTDGSTPTGSVELLDGATSLGIVPLIDGTATLPDVPLGDGTHEITAVYLGAPGFSSSSSTGLTQVVSAPAGPGSPSAPPASAVPGSPTAPPASAVPGSPNLTG